MAVRYDYELYVDGVRKFYNTSRFTLEIAEDYFVVLGGQPIGSYTYEVGEYLGWTTTQGGTTPDYKVGNTITVSEQVYLYSIPAPSITDLTGTKWLFNDSGINLGSSNVSYNINFTSNSTYYELLRVFDSNYDDDPPNCIGYGADGIVYNGTWYNEAYRTIEITGGSDVTNASLISWLEANATQIVETSGKMYLGTSSISKMYFGNAEVSKVYFGQDLVYEKQSVATISFTIQGTTYQAEEGMTWAQWVDSAYNTKGYVIGYNNSIYPALGAPQIVYYPQLLDVVYSTDTIYANTAYVLGNVGGSN